MKNIIFACLIGLISQSSFAFDSLDCSFSMFENGSNKKVAPMLLHVSDDSVIKSVTKPGALVVTFNPVRVKQDSARIVVDGLEKNLPMTVGFYAFFSEFNELTFAIKGEFSDRLLIPTLDGNKLETFRYDNSLVTLTVDCELN